MLLTLNNPCFLLLKKKNGLLLNLNNSNNKCKLLCNALNLKYQNFLNIFSIPKNPRMSTIRFFQQSKIRTSLRITMIANSLEVEAERNSRHRLNLLTLKVKKRRRV